MRRLLFIRVQVHSVRSTVYFALDLGSFGQSVSVNEAAVLFCTAMDDPHIPNRDSQGKDFQRIPYLIKE